MEKLLGNCLCQGELHLLPEGVGGRRPDVSGARGEVVAKGDKTFVVVAPKAIICYRMEYCDPVSDSEPSLFFLQLYNL